MAQPPSDEDFSDNAVIFPITINSTGYTLDGLTYKSDVSSSNCAVANSSSSELGIEYFPISNGRFITFNFNPTINPGVVNNITQISIESANGSPFKLVSLEASVFEGMVRAFDTANPNSLLTENFTVKGFNTSDVEVASDDVDFTVSDANGSITYARNSSPYESGMLTFNSDWENVYKIVFQGTTSDVGSSNAVTMAFDNFDFEAAVTGPSAPTSVSLSASVFLEGAFDGSDLTSNLNSKIPLSQPFTFNSISGGTASSIPVGAVDWVVIELRETSSGATVGSGSGFLMNTGQIKDVDGSSDLNISLSGNSGSDFYLIVYHRNHVPVMSANAVDASSGTLTYDFTTAASQALGSSQVLLETNVYGMIAGDSDGSLSVDGSDLTSWRTSNGAVFSYGSNGRADLNLDGVINAIDLNEYHRSNSGKSNQVPSN